MSKPSWRYDEMNMDDLEEVLDIERDSFSVPWTPDMFICEFEQSVSMRRVARDGNGSVLGFLICWFIIDEAHLMNIAVAPQARGRGIGRFLLGNLIEECRGRGGRLMGLEVRPSNKAACALYESFGFRPIALRKAYYSDNNEDAILMEAELHNE